MGALTGVWRVCYNGANNMNIMEDMPEMDAEKIMQIFADTAYVRTGGSDAELKCAQYIAEWCWAMTGREAVLGAYETAIREQYRFFSFGDAMLIL